MMKFNISLKHFLLELLLAVGIAFVFGLFAKDFFFWLPINLILLLIWHHYNEFSLLQILSPTPPLAKPKGTTPLAHLSQTAAFHQARSRREKIQTRRLLSKLNRHTQSLPDALIICQTDGKIRWCNPAARELFDFFWDNKTSKNVLNVIFYPEFKTYFQQTNHKRPLVLFSHNQRYIEVNISRYDEHTLILIARDVSDFVRLLHGRQHFLANINHELRTPLTVLQGYLEMLEVDHSNPKLRYKAISAMKNQSQRMSHLLKQLSELAKIEGSNNAEHHAVNVSALILSLQRNTDILKQKQRIVFDITPDIYVLGDEAQLQSAISNLLDNALRHAGEHATIHVRWHRVEQEAHFSIEDNGIGIEPQHLAHLTERFYRVDASRNNKTGGSGLGLAIVKHALEQHQSTLEINSEVGKGSHFGFRIKKALLVEG